MARKLEQLIAMPKKSKSIRLTNRQIEILLALPATDLINELTRLRNSTKDTRELVVEALEKAARHLLAGEMEDQVRQVSTARAYLEEALGVEHPDIEDLITSTFVAALAEEALKTEKN
jgi:hypothetical protein